LKLILETHHKISESINGFQSKHFKISISWNFKILMQIVK